jgi:putative (di)nucleoside polyphosphate hydrolase
MDQIDRDGYRANVGIVLMHDDGRVFLGRRAGGRGWQFPQGGIRRGEPPEQALYRELREEIGLVEADVLLVAATERWLHYRLPDQFVRRNRRPLCIGQKQRWFLLRLRASAARVRFDATAQPEFDQWRWAGFWDPVREVVDFKRPVYFSALHELGIQAFPQGLPPYPEWWPGVAVEAAAPGDYSGGQSGAAPAC